MMNVNQLREILSQQIEKLEADETTTQKANAISNACGKILSSIRLEMEYRRMIGNPRPITFIDYEETDAVHSA